MRRAALAALIVAGLTVAVPVRAAARAPQRPQVPEVTPVIVKSASNVTAFDFTPTGIIYYVNRLTGEVRTFNPSNMLDKHFFTVSDLRAEGERGLLGLTLDPAWPNPRNVYLYHTNDTTGKIQNWIYRLTAKNGMGTSPTKLVAFKASNATNHNGGVIHFGPDNMLYAVVGENANPANSQNTSTSNLGKVLRMTKSGGVPSGNPGFGAGRIWSYGLRNSFGFSWDPQNGNLWESENGPECNDEDNLIVMGGNYGWGPNETCSGSAPGNTNQDGPSPRLPEFFWPSPIAPTGVSFCNGCGLTGQEGHLIVGDCNNGDLHSFTLDAQRDDITGGDSILWNGPSCVFAVETGPGGVLYFSNGSGIYRLGN